jgi:hypothetical protein
MTWVWVAIAFVSGTASGVAFGHRARVVAYVVGYEDGLREGKD